jgi:hypothetical protein
VNHSMSSWNCVVPHEVRLLGVRCVVVLKREFWQT